MEELYYQLNYIRLCHKASNYLSQDDMMEILYYNTRDRFTNVKGFISIKNINLNRSDYAKDRVLNKIKLIYLELTKDICNNYFCNSSNSPTLQEIIKQISKIR